jgi:hypothetical protein
MRKDGWHQFLVSLDAHGRGRIAVLEDDQHGNAQPSGYQNVADPRDCRRYPNDGRGR